MQFYLIEKALILIFLSWRLLAEQMSGLRPDVGPSMVSKLRFLSMSEFYCMMEVLAQIDEPWSEWDSTVTSSDNKAVCPHNIFTT